MNDRFLRACRRQTVDKTPVWFMRQAGRYMADYRALRERYSLLDICAQPELAVAVTLQPVDVIEVDAAILFSDLLLPFTPMGLAFDFVKGEGPSVEHPIRSAADLSRIRTFEPREKLGHVLETIRLLRRELEGRVPLVGFVGAPFTMAAYAIEGGPSTTYAKTKAFMFAQPAADLALDQRSAGQQAQPQPQLRLVVVRALCDLGLGIQRYGALFHHAASAPITRVAPVVAAAPGEQK